MHQIKNYFNNNLFSISKLIEFLQKNEIELSKYELYNCIAEYSKNNFCYLPENLSQFIGEFINLSKPKTLLNINCGYGEILNYLNCKDVSASDINNDNFLITKYLFPELYITNIEIFEIYKNDKFDVVYSFPPFGISLKINNANEFSEIHYIKKAISLVKQDGEIYLLLPNSFLNNIKFENFRNEIVENLQISCIINIPVGYIKYSAIELSVIKLTKTKSTTKTKYLQFNNTSEIIQKIITNKSDFEIELKDESIKRWDYSFHNPKNLSFKDDLLKYNDVKKIEDLAEIILGKQIPKEDLIENGTYLVLTPKHINNFAIEHDDNQMFINSISEKDTRFLLKIGDVVIPRFRIDKKLKIYLHTNDKLKIIVNHNLLIFRGINAEYITTFLKTASGAKNFNQQLDRVAKGAAVPLISIQDLKNILIPIIPIDLEDATFKKINESNETDIYETLNSFIELEKILIGNRDGLELLQVIKTSYEKKSAELDELKILISTFQEIRLFDNLSEEERILQFQSHIQNNIHIEPDQIAYFENIFKKEFQLFPIFESFSRIYIPEAEYIYHSLSKLSNPDYSPFIIQYCRALENEFLKKIFRAFLHYLKNNNINLENEFNWDFSKKENGKPNDEKTFEFANNLKKYIFKEPENWRFTIGDMNLILSKLNGTEAKSSINKSPLLQKFKTFVLDNFEQQIINIEFLKQIQNISDNYRNKSAHPSEFINDKEKAIEFRILIKECLIKFIENYKNKINPLQ